MSTFREKATLIIALVVLICGFFLLYTGRDGEVKAIMGLVVGFYFGQYLPPPGKSKNNENNPNGISG